MKIACPSCSQRIEITDEVLESLRGQVSFSCPACGSDVPVPDADGNPIHQVAEPPDFSLPVVGRYQVTRLLGRGGAGAVYLARDLKKSRKVALRLLPAEFTDFPGAAERFQKEGRTLATLDHPHLVRLHDYGLTEDGSPYLAMEFVEGKDLRTLRDEGKLTLPDALRLISEAADALHHAHRKGLVHHDLRPGNILVTADGSAKVADFGLVRITGADSRPHLAPGLGQDGVAMDLSPYMAPEQESGEPVDHRADLYALGAILYHLLTGALPRGGGSRLPGRLSDLEGGLDPILRHALQTRSEDRYQAAEEFKADLDAARKQISGGVLPAGIPPAPLAAIPIIPGEELAVFRQAAARATSRGRQSPIVESLEEGLAGPDDSHSATGRGKRRALMVTALLGLVAIGGIAAYLALRNEAGMREPIAAIKAIGDADLAPPEPVGIEVAGAAEDTVLPPAPPPDSVFPPTAPPPLATEQPPPDGRTPSHGKVAEEALAPMGGIGVLLAADGALPRMIRVVEEGPAGRAGLRAGAEIAEVNGISTAGKTVGEMVKLLRGPVGSSVEVAVVAPGARESMRLAFSRKDIQLPPAGPLVAMRDGILWLKPVSFDRETPAEIKLLIENHPETRGITLDLRGTRGGVSDALAEVAGLFLREDSVLWHLRLADGSLSSWKRGTDAPVKLPLAVWVDAGTSHGGELLAWALQGNKRAKVLGTPTAGARAYLREVVPAPDGSLKMEDRGVYLMDVAGSVARVTPDIVLGGGESPEEFAKAAFDSIYPPGADALETWSRADGQAIEACFRRITGDTLIIWMDGKEYSILLASLSPASVARARELAAAMPAVDNR